MDFTEIHCINQMCKDKNIIMGGSGGRFGGRLTYAVVECPNCGLKLTVLPMKPEYEYSIQAQTAEERQEEYKQKQIDKDKLEYANKLIAHGLTI